MKFATKSSGKGIDIRRQRLTSILQKRTHSRGATLSFSIGTTHFSCTACLSAPQILSDCDASYSLYVRQCVFGISIKNNITHKCTHKLKAFSIIRWIFFSSFDSNMHQAQRIGSIAHALCSYSLFRGAKTKLAITKSGLKTGNLLSCGGCEWRAGGQKKRILCVLLPFLRARVDALTIPQIFNIEKAYSSAHKNMHK